VRSGEQKLIDSEKNPTDENGQEFWSRFRMYLFSGLLVLGPTAVTLWVLVQLLVWMDGILGEILRFPWFEYRRIPGLGFIVMLGLLLLTGWLTHRYASESVLRTWERVLLRIPFFRVIYSSAKQLGEALLTEKRTVFRQVVLVRWPHPDLWAIGLVTAPPPKVLSEKAGEGLVSVFVPSTPNPTTGFYHLVPADRVIPIDLTVEQGLQMVVSGGVIRPPEDAVGEGSKEMELPAGKTPEISPLQGSDRESPPEDTARDAS
jgi:uncharacterized membrane protein